MREYTHMHAYTHIHAYTHMHIDKNMHTHTHTNIYKYTLHVNFSAFIIARQLMQMHIYNSLLWIAIALPHT